MRNILTPCLGLAVTVSTAGLASAASWTESPATNKTDRASWTLSVRIPGMGSPEAPTDLTFPIQYKKPDVSLPTWGDLKNLGKTLGKKGVEQGCEMLAEKAGGLAGRALLTPLGAGEIGEGIGMGLGNLTGQVGGHLLGKLLFDK